MQKINFIQSTELVGNNDQVGLAEILLHHMQELSVNPLQAITILVPNLTLASWLNDFITKELSIACNINFMLLGKFIEASYNKNNPNSELFNFEQAKFIIYDYLSALKHNDPEFQPIKNYLFKQNQLQLTAAFNLASQLSNVFHEYIYLRTELVANFQLKQQLTPWQENIWVHLFKQIADKKTYIDIYQFFQQTPAIAKLPENIFIFGISNIYSSQLDILEKIATYTQVNWYAVAVSNHYYGDLLSDNAKLHLEHKILRAPKLQLADLYLTDGNPLVANLATASREFNELLLARDITVKYFEVPQIQPDTNTSLLKLLQYDIHNILHRTSDDYRLNQGLDCYAKPLNLTNPNGIKVNVCYTRMREVQVLFNQLIAELASNPSLDLSEILITAPDIDNYAPYLRAVLNNEYALTNTNKIVKLPFVITGNMFKNNFRALQGLKSIFNLPYALPVSYILELLNDSLLMHNLNLSQADIDTIHNYLHDNHTHFGYDSADYAIYDYKNFDIHSLKRLLVNLTLGICMPKTIADELEQLPLFKTTKDNYAFYDNIENSQLMLCNKLIKLIELLVSVRNTLYSDHTSYNQLAVDNLIKLIELIKVTILIDTTDCLVIDEFIGYLKQTKLIYPINLGVLNSIIDNYCSSFNTKVIFTGKLTCASMQAINQIPYRVIYVLGLNFGEFPRVYNPNKLSILSKDWAIADRNLNLEDKQLFLNIILAAKERLYLSYIGRSQSDNQILEPAPVLKLLLDTLKNSLDNGEELIEQIVELHSLHPFYNNKQANYSAFWGSLSGIIANEAIDKRWDFNTDSVFNLNQEQQEFWHSFDLRRLTNTFLYTNNNLYSVLRLNNYRETKILEDYENLELFSYDVRRMLYLEFSKLTQAALAKLYHTGELANYLHVKGIIGYDHIGKYQLTTLFSLYFAYLAINDTSLLMLEFYSPKYALTIKDQVAVNANNIILCEDFVNIRSHISGDMAKYKISYKLQVKCLLHCLLAKFAKFSDQLGHEVIIGKVYLRLLSFEQNAIEYLVELNSGIDSAKLLGEILRLYQYSLTNPVLIHRGAIEAYIAANDSDKVIKAKQVYNNSYQNKELEALYLDPVFASITENYFVHAKEVGVNTITWIGELLRALKFTEVKQYANTSTA